MWLKFFKAWIKKTLCSCISHKSSSGRTAQPNRNQNTQYTFHALYWYVLLFIFSSFTLYVRLPLRYIRRNRYLFWGKFPSSIASSFFYRTYDARNHLDLTKFPTFLRVDTRHRLCSYPPFVIRILMRIARAVNIALGNLPLFWILSGLPGCLLTSLFSAF